MNLRQTATTNSSSGSWGFAGEYDTICKRKVKYVCESSVEDSRGGELRKGRALSGVKTQRSVALGRDCLGWKAGVQKEVTGGR